jgi:hypothetical protein
LQEAWLPLNSRFVMKNKNNFAKLKGSNVGIRLYPIAVRKWKIKKRKMKFTELLKNIMS